MFYVPDAIIIIIFFFLCSGCHLCFKIIIAPALDHCTELHQPEVTRLGATSNGCGDRYFIGTRLDRLYVSWSPWQLANARYHTTTIDPVTEMKERAASDHTAVDSRISTRKPTSVGNRPIPKWLVDHPSPKVFLEQRLTRHDFKAMAPYQAVRAMKVEMRSASADALKEILNKPVESPEQKLQLILSLGRAIAS